MAALTDTRKITQYGVGPFPASMEYPVLAAANIHKGALVVRKHGQAYVQPASVAIGMGWAEVIGVALGDADNTSGSSGALSVECAHGTFKFVNGDTIVAADVGCAVYASDDQTAIKGSTGNQPFLGRVVDVLSDGVVVTLGPNVQGPIVLCKALIGQADLTNATTTQSVTLGVCPPNFRLMGRELNGTVFSGGGTGSATVSIGGSSATSIVNAADIFTGATLPKRGTDGALGTDMLADFGGQTIAALFTADTTVAAYTAGSLEITLMFAKAG